MCRRGNLECTLFEFALWRTPLATWIFYTSHPRIMPPAVPSTPLVPPITLPALCEELSSHLHIPSPLASMSAGIAALQRIYVILPYDL